MHANSRFDDLYMEERMEAIGEIIMEQGYPTVLHFQVITTSDANKHWSLVCESRPLC